jgi:hypothetical protein
MKYTITIPRKIVEAISLFQSRDTSREIINAMSVEVRRVGPTAANVTLAAVNGRILGAYFAEGIEFDTGEPLPPDFAHDFIFNFEQALLLAPITVGHDAQTVLYIEVDVTAETVEFHNLHRGSAFIGRMVPGTFPAWRQLFSDASEPKPIVWAFDFALLTRFAHASRLLAKPTYVAPYEDARENLTVAGTERGRAITVGISDPHFMGIIMPLNIADEDMPHWGWAKMFEQPTP